MFYQHLLKLGKYHFCIMSERTLCYRTDNVQAKCSKSQKWEREARSTEMNVCVGWCVKRNSLWRYTTLPFNNFIEWMISTIVTICLWCHSKYRTNQTGYILKKFEIKIILFTQFLKWFYKMLTRKLYCSTLT